MNEFKKVTKATIKKAISESKIPFVNFNIGSVELETALLDTKKGNSEVRKVVEILESYGNIKYKAFRTGYGAWVFRFNEGWTATDELIRNNMD